MDGNATIICPLDQHGECAKELKQPLAPDDELICFYRERKLYRNLRCGTFKPAFLDPEKLGEYADPKKQGWSFARKKDIASDQRMREVARIARRGEPAIGYAATTVVQIQQIAIDVFGKKSKALGIIHDGRTYSEHVNVENCIALHEDKAKQLRDDLLEEMETNLHPLP